MLKLSLKLEYVLVCRLFGPVISWTFVAYSDDLVAYSDQVVAYSDRAVAYSAQDSLIRPTDLVPFAYSDPVAYSDPGLQIVP